MTLLWFVALASLAAALVAWRKARAAERRAEQLSQMYWELKYQHGELRARLERLAPPGESAAAARPGADAPGGAPAEGTVSGGFIPLSSLKR